MKPGYYDRYQLPGVDSDRARANAQLFLTGARSIDHVTVDSLARQYRLSAKTAEYMLTVARQRREAPHA